MRSKEVEKAINDLRFIIVTDIYDNEVRIDKTKVINEYNQSVGTVLDYIKSLEKEIERFNNELDLDYVDNNFIHKDKIREQIKWLEHDIEKTKKKTESYIGDYRKARLRAFNTKSKEIKGRLEKLLEE